MTVQGSLHFWNNSIPDRFRSPLSGIFFKSVLLSLVDALSLACTHAWYRFLGVLNGCSLWCVAMYIFSISAVEDFSL